MAGAALGARLLHGVVLIQWVGHAKVLRPPRDQLPGCGDITVAGAGEDRGTAQGVLIGNRIGTVRERVTGIGEALAVIGAELAGLLAQDGHLCVAGRLEGFEGLAVLCCLPVLQELGQVGGREGDGGIPGHVHVHRVRRSLGDALVGADHLADPLAGTIRRSLHQLEARIVVGAAIDQGHLGDMAGAVPAAGDDSPDRLALRVELRVALIPDIRPRDADRVPAKRAGLDQPLGFSFHDKRLQVVPVEFKALAGRVALGLMLHADICPGVKPLTKGFKGPFGINYLKIPVNGPVRHLSPHHEVPVRGLLHLLDGE